MKHFKLAMEDNDLPLEVEQVISIQAKEDSTDPSDMDDVLDYEQELQRMQEAKAEGTPDADLDATDPEAESGETQEADGTEPVEGETPEEAEAPAEEDADQEDSEAALEAYMVLHAGKKVTAKNLNSFPAGPIRDRAAHKLMEKHANQHKALHTGMEALGLLFESASFEGAKEKVDSFLGSAKQLGYNVSTVSLESGEADKRSILTKVWETIQKMLKRIKEMVMAVVNWFADMIKRVFGKAEGNLKEAAKVAKNVAGIAKSNALKESEVAVDVLGKLSKITVNLPTSLTGKGMTIEDFADQMQTLPKKVDDLHKWVAGPLFSIVKFSDFIRAATSGNVQVDDSEPVEEFEKAVKRVFLDAMSMAASSRKDYTCPGISLTDSIEYEYLFKNRLTDIIADIMETGYHNDPIVMARVQGKEVSLDAPIYENLFKGESSVSLGIKDATITDYVQLAEKISASCDKTQNQLDGNVFLSVGKVYTKNVDAFTDAMQKMINNSADPSGENLRRRAVAVIRGQEAANAIMNLFLRSAGKVMTRELAVVSTAVVNVSNKMAGVLGVAVGSTATENYLDAVTDSDVDKLYDLTEVNKDMVDVEAGLEAWREIVALSKVYGTTANKQKSFENLRSDFRDINKTMRYFGFEQFETTKWDGVSLEGYTARRSVSMEADSWFARVGKNILTFIRESAKRIWAWLVGFFASEQKHLEWSNAKDRAAREKFNKVTSENQAILKQYNGDVANLLTKFDSVEYADNCFTAGKSSSLIELPVLIKAINDTYANMVTVNTSYAALAVFGLNKKSSLAVANTFTGKANQGNLMMWSNVRVGNWLKETSDFGSANFDYADGLKLYEAKDVGAGYTFYMTNIDPSLDVTEYSKFMAKHAELLRGGFVRPDNKVPADGNVLFKGFLTDQGHRTEISTRLIELKELANVQARAFYEKTGKVIVGLSKSFSSEMDKTKSLNVEGLTYEEAAIMDFNIRVAESDFKVLKALLQEPVVKIQKHYRHLDGSMKAIVDECTRLIQRYTMEVNKILSNKPEM